MSAVLAELTAETSASTADAAKLSDREAKNMAIIQKMSDQLDKYRRALRAAVGDTDTGTDTYLFQQAPV